MYSTTLVLQCGLLAAFIVDGVVGVSTFLRATATTKKYAAAGGGCQFVAHRPDDSEAVISADGPQVLFRRGEVMVVESKPMRYLVSRAQDGTCNEQAEQLCSTSSGSNDNTNNASSSAGSCEGVPCVPAGNGDALLSYLRSMVGGALTSRPAPSRSVVIGLGSGALAAFVAQAFPEGNVDAVDLDADVLAAAPCFGVRQSSQLQLVQSEGRAFLTSAGNFAYDAIFLDAFDASGALPPCLATLEFFQMVAQKLSPDQGVLALNLGFKDGQGAVLAAIKKVFMHVAVGSAPKETNTVVLASQTEIIVPGSDAGPAELLKPGSVNANLTRWARQAVFKMALAKTVADASFQDAPKSDAGEGCAVASGA